MSTPPETQAKDTSAMRKDIISRMSQIIIGTILTATFLFLGAGRLDWTMGWVYIGLNIIGLFINATILFTKNPELIAARARLPNEETAKFDKVFGLVYTLMLLATMAVSGLDAGRFGWSTVPTWVQYVSIALFIFGWFFSLWAMVSNKHFETTVRIQVDRGHKTVTNGPYAIVRHPGYVGFILLYSATPTLLGSWWGLVPVGVLTVVFILRTLLEDQTLLKELPDYQAYAQEVRYRLLPGIW
jgi:protein-S-isoprenylcysteine O-methyltransferase Ste14